MQTIEYPVTFVGVGLTNSENPQDAGDAATGNLNAKMFKFFKANPHLQVKGAPKLYHSTGDGYFFISNTIVVKEEIE